MKCGTPHADGGGDDGEPMSCPVPQKTDPGTKKAPAKTVTISDVAEYAPQKATISGQPDGWAVLNLEANYLADVKPTTVTAPLLGATASVRFTPVSYRWDYGDGTVRTSSTPGETWKELGQHEFTATATSHAFTERGTYTGSLTVGYAAAYRFDHGAWHHIAGTVTGASVEFSTLVVEEHTVLTTNE